MPVLSIVRNSVLSVANLDSSVVANQTMADDVISQNQSMYELSIKPEILSNSSYSPYLTSWITQLCAADVLDRMRRADGASSSLQGAGLTVGAPDDLGNSLRETALRALQACLRTIGRPSVDSTTTGDSSASQSAQESLFGDSEYNRRSSAASGSDGW